VVSVSNHGLHLHNSSVKFAALAPTPLRTQKQPSSERSPYVVINRRRYHPQPLLRAVKGRKVNITVTRTSPPSVRQHHGAEEVCLTAQDSMQSRGPERAVLSWPIRTSKNSSFDLRSSTRIPSVLRAALCVLNRTRTLEVTRPVLQ